MGDWPDSATRHSKAVVLAEARRRGLIAPDGGAVWLYMFHDMYGVAHFRHVDGRAWMQMLPDDAEADAAVDAKGNTGAVDSSPADGAAEAEARNDNSRNEGTEQ